MEVVKYTCFQSIGRSHSVPIKCIVQDYKHET